MKSKTFLVALSVSLSISGCGFQDGKPDTNVEEPKAQNSLRDKSATYEFKLTRVMDTTQVKPSEVLSFSCETITARLIEVTTSCADFGIAIGNIDWQTWTANGAVGTGKYLVNNCDPDCASGKVSKLPVRINLNGLYTDGDRYFLRYLTFKERGELADSEKIEGTWDLAEFYLETPDMRSGS